VASRIVIQADSVDDLKAEAVKLFPILGADEGANRSVIRLVEAAVLWHQAPGEGPHAKLAAAVEDWLHQYRRVCHQSGGVPTQAFPQHELALAAEGEDPGKAAAPAAGEKPMVRSPLPADVGSKGRAEKLVAPGFYEAMCSNCGMDPVAKVKTVPTHADQAFSCPGCGQPGVRIVVSEDGEPLPFADGEPEASWIAHPVTGPTLVKPSEQKGVVDMSTKSAEPCKPAGKPAASGKGKPAAKRSTRKK